MYRLRFPGIFSPSAVLVALLVFGLPAGAGAQPAEDATPERVVLDQRPGEGERCIVCKQQIHGDDVIEVRYQGRRFFVKAEMLADFDAEPLRYFEDLQARSGLFDERAVGAGKVSYGWLAFGTYVVVGLVFAALCGYLAIGRGHLPLPWFFAGLAGNVAALFVLLKSPRGPLEGGMPPGLTKVPVTRAPVPCPGCGATNHPVATECGGCGAELTPVVEPETARA